MRGVVLWPEGGGAGFRGRVAACRGLICGGRGVVCSAPGVLGGTGWAVVCTGPSCSGEGVAAWAGQGMRGAVVLRVRCPRGCMLCCTLCPLAAFGAAMRTAR